MSLSTVCLFLQRISILASALDETDGSLAGLPAFRLLASKLGLGQVLVRLPVIEGVFTVILPDSATRATGFPDSENTERSYTLLCRKIVLIQLTQTF